MYRRRGYFFLRSSSASISGASSKNPVASVAMVLAIAGVAAGATGSATATATGSATAGASDAAHPSIRLSGPKSTLTFGQCRAKGLNLALKSAAKSRAVILYPRNWRNLSAWML
jgi:hypothetical protein